MPKSLVKVAIERLIARGELFCATVTCYDYQINKSWFDSICNKYGVTNNLYC